MRTVKSGAALTMQGKYPPYKICHETNHLEKDRDFKGKGPNQCTFVRKWDTLGTNNLEKYYFFKGKGPTNVDFVKKQYILKETVRRNRQ